MQSLVRGAISGALGLAENVLVTSLEVVRLINVALADASVPPEPATKAQETPAAPASAARAPAWRPPETGDLEHTADVLKARARVRPPRASIKASRNSAKTTTTSAGGSATGASGRRPPPARPRGERDDE